MIPRHAQEQIARIQQRQRDLEGERRCARYDAISDAQEAQRWVDQARHATWMGAIQSERYIVDPLTNAAKFWSDARKSARRAGHLHGELVLLDEELDAYEVAARDVDAEAAE